MLRITLVSHNAERAVLKIEGWLCGRATDLLDRERVRWAGQVDQVVLDLTGVCFVDKAGLAVLKDWESSQVVLQSGATFIQALLRRHRLEVKPAEGLEG